MRVRGLPARRLRADYDSAPGWREDDVKWTKQSLRGIATVALVSFSLAGYGAAKPAKEPQALPLQFQKSERVKNGTFAYVAAGTQAGPTRYVASNVMVTQPVVVTLKSDNPKEMLRLAVSKTQWNKAEREVSTGADGLVRVAFRTQGDFGVTVGGAGSGKPYKLAVWVGDEIKRPMSPAIVPKAAWKPTGAKGK